MDTFMCQVESDILISQEKDMETLNSGSSQILPYMLFPLAGPDLYPL